MNSISPDTSLGKNLLEIKESRGNEENNNPNEKLSFLPQVLGIRSANSLRSDLNV